MPISNLIIPCRCIKCNKPMVISGIQVFGDDPDQSKLRATIEAAKSNALCDIDKMRKQYYAKMGRMEEWETL